MKHADDRPDDPDDDAPCLACFYFELRMNFIPTSSFPLSRLEVAGNKIRLLLICCQYARCMRQGSIS